MINEMVLLLTVHGCGDWIFVFTKMQNVLADFVEMKDFVYLREQTAGITAAFVLFTD